MTRASTAIAGVSASAVAGLLSLAVGIALLPIVIQTVGAAPYGVWLVFTSVATMLNYSDLGIGAALVHFGSRERAGDRSQGSAQQLASAAFIWSFLAAAVVTPLFAVFAVFYANSVDVVGETESLLMVCLAVGLVFATIVLRPFSALLISQGRLPLERRFQATATIFRAVSSLSACLIFNDIVLLVISEAISIVLPFLLSFVTVTFSPSRLAPIGRDTFSRTRVMLKYSVRSFVVNLTGVAILQSGIVIVGLILGPAQTTYYAAAFRVYTSVRQLMAWVLDPFRSTLSRLSVAGNEAFLSAVYAIALGVITVSCIGGITLAIATPALVPLWLGPSVPATEISIATMILVASIVINAVHLPLIPAGDASGRPGAFFGIQAFWLIVYIAVALPLTGIYGFVGTAIALVVPLPMVEALYLWHSRNVVSLSIKSWRIRVLVPAAWLVLGQAVGATAVALAVFFLVDDPWNWLTIAAGSVAGGLVTLYLLKRRGPLSSVLSVLQESL